MSEREARQLAAGRAVDEAPRDPSLLMRRAIRAVAAAHAVVAKSYELISRPRSAADGGADTVGDADADSQRAMLRATVDDYIIHLRDAGKPPERALVHLKLVLNETPTHELAATERDRLLEEIVRWGIDAYFRARQTGFVKVPTAVVKGVIRESLATLAESGLHALLAQLNARTRYRYTSALHIESPLLQTIATFDRESPERRCGGDIHLLANTFCGIVAERRQMFSTPNARTDARLAAHPARHSAARSYQGAPIFTRNWRVWGTLCHFDIRPRLLIEDEVDVLVWVAGSLPSSWLERDRSRVDAGTAQPRA